MVLASGKSLCVPHACEKKSNQLNLLFFLVVVVFFFGFVLFFLITPI